MEENKKNDQWMIENIPDSDETDLIHNNLVMLQNIFFNKDNIHSFSRLRLYWLYRWIGMPQMNDYQNDTIGSTEKKRIEFLLKIWSRPYFHPFNTTEDSYLKIMRNKRCYIIALSSTIEGSIRISYFKDGSVKHHRIQVDEYVTKSKIEKIGYDLEKFENVIDNHIQTFSYHPTSHTIAIYNPDDK